MQEIENIELNVEDGMHGKYLIFRAGDGSYGIEIKYVDDIIGVQAITEVPHTHTYVKGIINLRGTIVPVMDIKFRFGDSETEFTSRTCIIVLSMDNMNLGLIVDEVQEVILIDDENIQEPPKLGNQGIKDDYVKNIGLVGEGVKQLLYIHKIFEEEELSEYQ